MRFNSNLGSYGFSNQAPAAHFDYKPPQDPPNVVYIDDDIIVLNKPCGLLSVPGRQKQHEDSLQIRAKEHFGDARIVHRLDMDTSGLMILARNANSHRHLGLQFEKRYIKKRYQAAVKGFVDAQAGSIDLPLICDWPKRPKQKVCFEMGKNAQTHWRVLQSGALFSLLELKPITGRSHQLRVHLLACGHPIWGDTFYGGGKDEHFRLCLHASQLEFRHPDGGAWMKFISEHSFGLGLNEEIIKAKNLTSERI